MQSRPSSKITFCSDEAIQLEGPNEWDECDLEIGLPCEQWESIRLFLQGKPLQSYLVLIGGKRVIRARWPKAGPGHYKLRLEAAQHEEERFITILPAKLGKEDYLQLLEELEYKLPCAIALNLKRCRAFSSMIFEPPRSSTLEQEHLRIRRVLLGTSERLGILKLLQLLESDCHVTLSREKLFLPSWSAASIDQTRLHEALFRSGNVLPDGRLVGVPSSRCQESRDTYENRFVASFVELVASRLARLIAALSIVSSTEVPELKTLLRLLQQRSKFLRNVSSLTGEPKFISMVLLNKPNYRATLESYLEFAKHSTVILDEPALDAPLNAFPDLYQLWGTLKVLESLSDHCANRKLQCLSQTLLVRVGGTFLLRLSPKGSRIAAFTDSKSNTQVSVFREPTYSKKSPDIRSLSHSQIPDIVVEVRREGEAPQLVLFDPKYKLASADRTPMKEDIDKMHVYRDSLITASTGEHVVQYAAIMYPGIHMQYSDSLAALPALPQAESQLKAALKDVFEKFIP